VKTVILGGGLTGVTLARLLNERQEDTLVLEAQPHIGGLCRSVNIEGFTFDSGGSHIIFSRDKEVLGFMHSVLSDNIGFRNRDTKVFYKSKFVKYPFENGLSMLPKEDTFYCLNEFIRTLIENEKGEGNKPETFKDWIISNFGKGIGELYLIPYNEKIWKCKTEDMSLHWVEGRVPSPPVEDIIRSAVGIETEGYTHQSVFAYPVNGGIEALIHAIAEPVKDSIQTEYIVKSIRKDGKNWIISDGEKTVYADSIISTIPLQSLIPCLEDVPLEVKDALANLRYNSLVSVFIGLKGETSPYSWVYIPGKEDGMMHRVAYLSNYSTNVAPPGYSAILAEITFNEGDEVSSMNDTEIIANVIESMDKLNFINKENVVFSGSAREPYAYVVYNLQYEENLKVVKKFLKLLGIPLVGRFSQFEYLNMDACIRSVMDYLKERPVKVADQE